MERQTWSEELIFFKQWSGICGVSVVASPDVEISLQIKMFGGVKMSIVDNRLDIFRINNSADWSSGVDDSVFWPARKMFEKVGVNHGIYDFVSIRLKSRLISVYSLP